jgi:adenosine deaminase
MTYQHFPKVELHTHLEGSAPPDFIRSLAREKNIDLSRIFNEDGGYIFRDFEHFLKVYEAACEPLQTPQDFYRLTRAVLEEFASHGVVYAETFVSPDFCGGGDVVKWRDYLAAMEQAADEMSDTITLKAIATIIRHAGPEQAKRTARCAVETHNGFLTGFGLAGAEMMHRPGDFAYSFDMAREAGMHLTAHAGEWGGPDMVLETLDLLKVERVGHGVNAVSDSDLVMRLAEEGITLEVCPGSNIVLRAIDRWEDHPIQTLREAGVPVTVSTDDPPFFHTTMTAEYDNLARVFGYGDDDFRALNETAITAAFCDDATKKAVRARLEKA